LILSDLLRKHSDKLFHSDAPTEKKSISGGATQTKPINVSIGTSSHYRKQLECHNLSEMESQEQNYHGHHQRPNTHKKNFSDLNFESATAFDFFYRYMCIVVVWNKSGLRRLPFPQ